MYYRRALLSGFNRIFTLPRLSVPFTLILGLTLSAMLLVVTIAHQALLKPLPNIVDEQQLTHVDIKLQMSEKVSLSFLTMEVFAYFERDLADFGQWALLSTRSEKVQLNDTLLEVESFYGSLGTLSTLGTPVIYGQQPSADNVSSGVWISKSIWQNSFNSDPQIHKQTLLLQNKPQPILGVVADIVAIPNSSNLNTEQIWQFTDQTQFLGNKSDSSQFSLSNRLLLRQHKAISIESIEQWVNNYIDTETSEQQKTFYKAAPLKVSISSFRDSINGSLTSLTGILFFAAAALLLMACLNLSNLFIAHYQSRNKEFAIQISLGAPINRLRRIAMLENLPIFVIAAIIGLITAAWLVRALLYLYPNPSFMLQQLSIDLPTIGVALVIVLLLNAIFALLITVDVKKSALCKTLNNSGKGTPAQQNQWLSKGLMILQLAIASIIVVSAIMSVKQSYQLINQDLGYHLKNSYEITIPFKDQSELVSFRESKGDELTQLTESLAAKVQQQVAVEQVIFTPQSPISNSFSISMYMDEDTGQAQTIATRGLSENYFDAYDIKFLAGRNLTAEEIRNNENKVVIEQAYAEHLAKDEPWQNIVNSQIKLTGNEDDWFTVVGIVNNTVNTPGSKQDFMPTLYKARSINSNTLSFQVQLAQGESLTLTDVQQAIGNIDPRFGEIELQYLPDMIAEGTRNQRIVLWLNIGVTLLVIGLAAIGIAGLSQMNAAKMRYELAIRMATGASQKNLLTLMVKQASTVLLAGIGLGFVLSAVLYTKLQPSTNLIPEFSWSGMFMIDLLLAAVMLLATAIPVWKVIKNQPMQALREL